MSTEKCLIFIGRSCWKNYKFFVAKPFPGVAYPLKLRTSLISLDLLNLTDLPNFRTSFSERGIESSFDLGKIFGYKKSCGELSLFKCRAVGRSENSGVPVLFGGHNLSSLVEIGGATSLKCNAKLPTSSVFRRSARPDPASGQ